MDIKDIELLTILYSHGRADMSYLSSEIGISQPNVDRRLKLMNRNGVLKGFSAYFDRRLFGYDTTYVKLHFRMRDMDRVISDVSKMTQVASVYPNMDDFMLVEVVHWDRDMLVSAIRAMERVAKPMTVSAHFIPRLPDNIPETPERKDLLLLKYLVEDGRLPEDTLASLCKMKEEEVVQRISRMSREGVFQVRPIIQEDLVQPFPTFTTLLTLTGDRGLPECFSDLRNMGRGTFQCIALDEPPGVMMKSFGKDLHAVDMMIERFRREDYVGDVSVIIPDTVIINRGVDLSIVNKAIG